MPPKEKKGESEQRVSEALESTCVHQWGFLAFLPAFRFSPKLWRADVVVV
jgi:hypothetical protein